MKEQSERISQALKAAVQMEEEGKKFYNKSGEGCDNLLAKNLFLHLAKAEDIHIRKINEVYKAVRSKSAWPQKETVFKQEKSLKSVFREAVDEMGKSCQIASSELEALKTAMTLEDKSYSFYTSRTAEATSSAEKSFYQALAGEEREHHLLLLDSYEYLIDPSSWFLKNERWGLDGA